MKPFSELTGRQRAVEILRWLAVPVVAVLTMFVLQTLARLAIPPVYAQLPGTPPPTAPIIPPIVTYRALSILLAVAFVAAGALTAPRRRLLAATVLAALWIVYAFLIHVLVHLGRGPPHYLDFALAATAAGGGIALIYWLETAVTGRR